MSSLSALRTPYLAIMAALAALSALMAARGVAIVALYVTLGLGLPLIFAATPLAYGLCLAPLFLAPAMAKPARFAASALALAALALLPHIVGLNEAQKFAAAAQSADQAPAAAPDVATLEIRIPDSLKYLVTSGDDTPCGRECRALAANAKLRWLRLVAEHPSGAPTRQLFRFARGAECGGGVCALIGADAGESADLTLQFSGPDWRNWKPRRNGLAVEKSWIAVTATQSNATGDQPIMRRTQAVIEIPFAPALFGPEISGTGSSGAHLLGKDTPFGAVTLAGALTELGLANDAAVAAQVPPRGPFGIKVTPQLTSEARAVLDLPQTTAFGGAQTRIVNDWLVAARDLSVWTPEENNLLRRIVRDDRFQGLGFIEQVFGFHPDVARAVLPDVFATLRQKGAATHSGAYHLALHFPTMNAALLAPHAADALALYNRDAPTRRLMLPAMGRFGFDPSPYLLPIDADRADPALTQLRIRGACLADKRWAPAMLDGLRAGALRMQQAPLPPDADRAARSRNLRERRTFDMLLGAIAAMGDENFANQHAFDLHDGGQTANRRRRTHPC